MQARLDKIATDKTNKREEIGRWMSGSCWGVSAGGIRWQRWARNGQKLGVQVALPCSANQRRLKAPLSHHLNLASMRRFISLVPCGLGGLDWQGSRCPFHYSYSTRPHLPLPPLHLSPFTFFFAFLLPDLHVAAVDVVFSQSLRISIQSLI